MVVVRELRGNGEEAFLSVVLGLINGLFWDGGCWLEGTVFFE